MREWYGLYFPEAEKLIRDHEQLAKVISNEGKREINFTQFLGYYCF